MKKKVKKIKLRYKETSFFVVNPYQIQYTFYNIF